MQALATALKTTVCLLNGTGILKPSPPSCQSVFLCLLSPIRTVGKSGSRAEPCGSPLSPHQFKPTLLSPNPAPRLLLPVPGPQVPSPKPPWMRDPQSCSLVGAVGPLVFPICGERDKDHHLPLSPCTANISSPDPRGFLCSPKATKPETGEAKPQTEMARREK